MNAIDDLLAELCVLNFIIAATVRISRLIVGFASLVREHVIQAPTYLSTCTQLSMAGDGKPLLLRNISGVHGRPLLSITSTNDVPKGTNSRNKGVIIALSTK